MQFTFPDPCLEHRCPSKTTHEPSLLQVNLSSMKPRDEMPITLVPLIASMPPSSMHPTAEHPSEIATSMTIELQELLSQAMPDTSDPVPGCTAPRRLQSVTLGSQPLTEGEGSQQSESVGPYHSFPSSNPPTLHDPCVSTVSPASLVSPAPKTIQTANVSPSASPKSLSGLSWLSCQRSCSYYRRS